MPGVPQDDQTACLSPLSSGHGRFRLPAAYHLALRVNSFQCPSETASTVPSTTERASHSAIDSPRRMHCGAGIESTTEAVVDPRPRETKVHVVARTRAVVARRDIGRDDGVSIGGRGNACGVYSGTHAFCASDDRIIVAGGGGGGSDAMAGAANGGAGGGLTGGGGGAGGTQSSGGIGGGGGWYGGGSYTDNGTGGGGSGYITRLAISGSLLGSTHTGDGKVIVTTSSPECPFRIVHVDYARIAGVKARGTLRRHAGRARWPPTML